MHRTKFYGLYQIKINSSQLKPQHLNLKNKLKLKSTETFCLCGSKTNHLSTVFLLIIK